MPRLRTTSIALAATAATLLVPATAGATERFFGTTSANELVSFTAQAPNRFLSTEAIDGLAANETIVGMDQRPATGQLYALSSTGRLLVVSPASGETKVIGAAIPLLGTQFGFDFNPVVDRIRVVSNTGQNLRVNPDTGAVASVDGPIAYTPGDAGAGTTPTVSASAYTLGVFGQAAPATTTLYDIDATRDALVRQEPPNNGTLVTVGALGVDASDQVSFDIAGNQVAYAAFNSPSYTGQRLYTLNLGTGAATLAAGSPRIGTGAGVTSLTAVGQVPDDTTAPAVAIGNYTTLRSLWLARGLKFTASCPELCYSTVTLRLGSTVLGSTTVAIGAPGTAVATIKLTPAGRAVAARASGKVAASISLTTHDAANNKRIQVARFRSAD